ncbi:MAG: hypothetical protein JKX74_05830, partial [Flavobacteriales bacterium]|nr:hypothetical protein [Flavobacteriales bacterium]
SGACNPGSEARLVSPCIDVTSLTSPTLSFFYHMAGADIGDLFVEVDSGAGYLIVDAISGPQQAVETDPWIQRIVALTGYTGIINIRFRGVTGAGFTSDIAVDDISVFQPPPNDVGVTSIMAPISGCGLTTTETITVQVVNFGTLAVDTIPVAYTIDGGAPIIDTIFATLLSGDTTTLSFTTPGDLSATATFILDSWTQFPGDGNNANDSTLGVAVTNAGPSIATFPYTEDFESGTLGQFTTSNVITALTWNNSTIRGTDPGHSNIRSAYFGNPADTTFSTGVVEGADLTLSCVDFSLLTDVRMSFNYFLETEALVGFDMAQVMVSTDGVAFTAIADNQGIANLVDPSGTWQNLDLDLTAYAGNPTVYVRFSFNSIDDINNTFEGFYIDDINIYVPPSADLGVIAVDAPNSGCVLTATETVTVQVFNYGTAAQDTFQVVYSLDGGPAVTDTIFATILPGDTAVFSFAVPADLSTAGLHTFDVWTNLVGDGNNANDSTVNYQVTHGVPVTVYPHFEDFEPEALCVTACGAACPLAGNWSNDPTDAIDWTANEGTTGSAGTGPTVDQTTGLATGNYLYTEASGGCNPGATASLLSSCLDISALSVPTVSYWYHMFGANMGTLYVEVNNGVSWVSVDSIVGQVQTADTDPWIGDSVDLSAFSGIIQIRFRGVTGAGFTSDLAIDDITVFDNVLPGDDVGVVSITSLASHCEDGTTETITIQVVNLGTVTADTIPVGYSVNGGTAELDTIFVTLLVGDTATFSFAVGTVMSPAGAYSVDAWTSYVGDVNSVNDSSNVGISIFANPAVALGADTSICVGTSVTLNTSNFGFASYLWSTGATDSTITTFLPAAYVLTVTDGNGCTGTDSIVVSLNPDLVLTMSKTDASCGGSDGTATVAVTGGTGPYNYLWNDPGAQTNDTATALAAASYSVIVTDAIGCTDSATVSVNNVGGPTVVASQISGVSCFGGSDGGVTVSVTGGTSPFTYLWDDPGAQTNDTATGLTATMVTVTVTDNAGCIATDNVTPTEPAVLALTASSANSNCGQSDGSASVVVTGGTGVYTYLWDDPSAQTTATAGNIPAATYKVIVSDANACTDSANVIVTDIAGG